MPKLFVAARYADVQATDGDSIKTRVLPDNRRAIVDVQHALLDWKRYILTAKRRDADLVFVVRKGDLATVQGGIRAHDGTETPEKNGDPRTTGNTEVTPIVGVQGRSPDDLLEVYVVNPDGSLQGPLWRQYLKDGLDPPELPLLQQFRKAVEAASKQGARKANKPLVRGGVWLRIRCAFYVGKVALPQKARRIFLLLGRLALAGIFLLLRVCKDQAGGELPLVHQINETFRSRCSRFKSMPTNCYRTQPPSTLLIPSPFELFLGIWLLSGIALRYSALCNSLLLGGFLFASWEPRVPSFSEHVPVELHGVPRRSI